MYCKSGQTNELIRPWRINWRVADGDQGSDRRVDVHEKIKRYAAITEFDETVLNQLTNRILISEPKKADAVKTQ